MTPLLLACVAVALAQLTVLQSVPSSRTPHSIAWDSGYVVSASEAILRVAPNNSTFPLITNVASLDISAIAFFGQTFYFCSSTQNGSYITALNRLDWSVLWTALIAFNGPPCEDITLAQNSDLLLTEPSQGTITRVSSQGETLWTETDPEYGPSALCFWNPHLLLAAYPEGLFVIQLNPNGSLGNRALVPIREGPSIVNPLKIKVLENQNVVVMNSSTVFLVAFDGKTASILQHTASNTTRLINIALRPGRTSHTIYDRQYHHLVLLGHPALNQTYFTIFQYSASEVYISYRWGWIVSISVVAVVVAFIVMGCSVLFIWRRFQKPQFYD